MATQLIAVGKQLVPLPAGITVADWALEKVRCQNPRIRAFLLSVRLLEGILDSNYAILHCSPRRLQEIWRRLLEIADVIRLEIAPSMAQPSNIPALEAARKRATLALKVVESTTLNHLEQLPGLSESQDLTKLRKLLCVSIGKLHAFLQDTFCEIIAADPRSLHDPDYFLSSRFPRDIEEAEWLYASVRRLEDYLEEFSEVNLSQLRKLAALNGEIPDGNAWKPILNVLDELREGLTLLLRETLALRGIRYDEMEALDRYSYDIPSRCQTLIELHTTALDIAEVIVKDAGEREREELVHELLSSHAAVARRLARLARSLSSSLLDLRAFVPLWIRSIEGRRALILTRDPGARPRQIGIYGAVARQNAKAGQLDP